MLFGRCNETLLTHSGLGFGFCVVDWVFVKWAFVVAAYVVSFFSPIIPPVENAGLIALKVYFSNEKLDDW